MAEKQIVTRTEKEIISRWIAALRSGEYKQGREVLRTEDDRYCCLGVLCDLARKDGGDNWHVDEPIVSRRFYYSPEYRARTYLPVCFTNIVPNHLQVKLSSLNDSGRTFEEIANVIENHYFNKL